MGGSPSRVLLGCGGVLVAGVLVAIAEMPLLTRGALPREVLEGAMPAAWSALGQSAFLALGGGVVAVVMLDVAAARRRAAGVFGVLAGAGFAAAGTTAVLGNLVAVSDSISWGVPVVMAALAFVLAPLMRDRGLLSLLVVSVAVGGMTALARRGALEERQAASQFAQCRESIIQAGWTRMFAALSPERSLEFRQALVVSLREPYVEESVDLVCVEHDSEDERLLREEGWRGVHLANGESEGLEPVQTAEPNLSIKVVLRPLEQHGPVAIIDPHEGTFTMRVLTPAGSVLQSTTDPLRGLRLFGEALDRFGDLIHPLPPESLILVKVHNALFPRGTRWVEMRLPASFDAR